jgi:hypothetical protein
LTGFIEDNDQDHSKKDNKDFVRNVCGFLAGTSTDSNPTILPGCASFLLKIL